MTASSRAMSDSSVVGVEDLRVPMRCVTPPSLGDGQWFFGYYDKSPWDASGRYLLAGRTTFLDRQPTADDELAVGMIDLHADPLRFVELDRTTAWCWQQGTMLQWVGPRFDRHIVYNRIVNGKPAGILRDVFSGETKVLPMPVYALSADGRTAVSLDFGRLHRLRPGYGYASVTEKNPNDLTPADNGVFAFDLPDGQPRLIASVAMLSRIDVRDEMRDVPHWVNHLEIDPTGVRVSFLHRWPCKGDPNFRTRLCCVKLDGSELNVVCDTPMFSHYDWRDDRTILAFAADPSGRRAFNLYDIHTGAVEPMGDVLPTIDGHCSYSPDRRWILNDTYPDKRRFITLMVYRHSDRKRVDIARLHSDPALKGPTRCDLHPRWSRDGKQVCVDSSHEGNRRIYVMDVGEITG